MPNFDWTWEGADLYYDGYIVQLEPDQTTQLEEFGHQPAIKNGSAPKITVYFQYSCLTRLGQPAGSLIAADWLDRLITV